MPACIEVRIERWPPADDTFRRRTAGSDRSALAHTKRTALRPNQPLGSAEVVHPFHPLRGQRFVVLKVRTVSGVEALSLRHTGLGSLAMPRDWTDWARPGSPPRSGIEPLMVDAFGLIALAELFAALRSGDLEVDQ
jgi:uncharacterized protein DUF5372